MCNNNCLQGRACTCLHMRDSAPNRWLREHPESAADAIVMMGCLIFTVAVLAIEFLNR